MNKIVVNRLETLRYTLENEIKSKQQLEDVEKCARKKKTILGKIKPVKRSLSSHKSKKKNKLIERSMPERISQTMAPSLRNDGMPVFSVTVQQGTQPKLQVPIFRLPPVMSAKTQIIATKIEAKPMLIISDDKRRELQFITSMMNIDNSALRPLIEDLVMRLELSKSYLTALNGPSDNATSTKKHMETPRFNPFVQESQSLQRQLVDSLENIKHHTLALKSNLIQAKPLITSSRLGLTGKDDNLVMLEPNSRGFRLLRKWGAEKMMNAILSIVTRIKGSRLSRWVTITNLIRRNALKSSFYHMKHLYHLVLLLNDLAKRHIKKKFDLWHSVSWLIHEKRRLAARKYAIINAQRLARGYVGRIKARRTKEWKKYLRREEFVVKIQSFLRMSHCLLAHRKYKRKKKELKSCIDIQRCIRGYLGRKKANRVRLQKKKLVAVVKIQSIGRMYIAGLVVNDLRLKKQEEVCIIRIQTSIRGYLSRLQVKRLRHVIRSERAAILLQKTIRGKLARRLRLKLIRLVKERQVREDQAARRIQKTFRGYRGKMKFKLVLIRHKQAKRKKNEAAIQIQRSIRGFLGRRRSKWMKKQRMDNMVRLARLWKEEFSDEDNAWFYTNQENGSAIWQPEASGYTKNDGRLVLSNGRIIEDPSIREAFELEEERKRLLALKPQSIKCVECGIKVAVYSCKQCMNDKYCRKCFEKLHAVGKRKEHLPTELGVVMCSECDDVTACRWCSVCDEGYCSVCWRKVHEKGIRRDHPFYEVSDEGLFSEFAKKSDGTIIEQEEEAQEDNAESGSAWAEYNDAEGYTYYYNGETGESTYERPY